MSAMDRKEWRNADELLARLNASSVSRTPLTLMLHGEVLNQLGDVANASGAFEAAEGLVDDLNDRVRLLFRAADVLCSSEDAGVDQVARAIGILERLLSIDPDAGSGVARKNLCALYYRRGVYDHVLVHARELEKIAEFREQALLWQADSCYFLDRKEEGMRLLDRLLPVAESLDEDKADWVLRVLLQYQRIEDAGGLVAAYRSSGRDQESFKVFDAQILYEAGDYESVVRALPAGFPGTGDLEQDRLAFYLRGRSLDKLSLFAEAHQAFSRMNSIALQASQPPQDQTCNALMELDFASLPSFPRGADLCYQPIFHIGFPRSGTTLLESILDTQSSVITLSEIDGMSAVRGFMESEGLRYPSDLCSLKQSQVEELRSIYFSRNRSYVPEGTSDLVIIDKLPLNILNIPLILMLFPGAKFVFSLRHPMDVCLSCFQQAFQTNDEMQFFTTVEGTFRRYREVMNAFEHCRNGLRPTILTVRYEDLVKDLDAVALEVFKFIGLEQLDASYKNFAEINKQKIIRTPSRDQVTKPIYTSSKERWRNYQEDLLPHAHIIQECLDLYGYQVS